MKDADRERLEEHTHRPPNHIDNTLSLSEQCLSVSSVPHTLTHYMTNADRMETCGRRGVGGRGASPLLARAHVTEAVGKQAGCSAVRVDTCTPCRAGVPLLGTHPTHMLAHECQRTRTSTLAVGLSLAQKAPTTTGGAADTETAFCTRNPSHVTEYGTTGNRTTTLLCTSVGGSPKTRSEQSRREYMNYGFTYIKLIHKKTKQYTLFQNYVQR